MKIKVTENKHTNKIWLNDSQYRALAQLSIEEAENLGHQLLFAAQNMRESEKQQ